MFGGACQSLMAKLPRERGPRRATLPIFIYHGEQFLTQKRPSSSRDACPLKITRHETRQKANLILQGGALHSAALTRGPRSLLSPQIKSQGGKNLLPFSVAAACQCLEQVLPKKKLLLLSQLSLNVRALKPPCTSALTALTEFIRELKTLNSCDFWESSKP